MSKVSEKREARRSEDESEEYDSNVYNSADSFIADEEESEVASSEDSDFDPAQRGQAPAKKKTFSGLTKEEVAMANLNIRKKRSGRLKKMKDAAPRSPEDFVDYGEHSGPRAALPAEATPGAADAEGDALEAHKDLLENIFNDEEFAEAPKAGGSREDEAKAGEDFSKMLAPEDRQKYFLTEQDQRIKKKDIPERLQLRFEGRAEPESEEIVHEARWIVNKLLERNRLARELLPVLEVKVYGVLENLLWKKQEVMFIWMYSRQDITSNVHSSSRVEHNYELSLEDLWFIYFADEEWQRCAEMRVSLARLLKLLERHEAPGPLSQMAADTAMDLDHLGACYEHLRFRLKSFVDEEEIEALLDQRSSGNKNGESAGGPRIRRMKKPNRLREMRTFGMHAVAAQISLTAEQLAENFEQGRQTHTPTLLRQRPNELSEEVSREDVGYLSRPVDTLTAICKMVAAQYFFHPVVRMHLKKLCADKLYVATRPTAKGRKALTVYHRYFPTKRITGKRLVSLDPFLWMLVLEAEAKGLVKVSFVMDYDRDPAWQSLLKKVKRVLLDQREPKSKAEALLVDSWNQVRGSIADNLVKLHAKPVFEKEFRKQLISRGRRAIIAEVKKEFRQIINIKPYRPSRQSYGGDEQADEPGPEAENQDKLLGLESVRVLACTMTSSLTANSQNAEAVFVALSPKGDIDGLLRLKNCFRKSVGLRNASRQATYDSNIKALKDFVIRHLPKVIVISPKSLVMQGLKIELNDLFTEIFDNLGNETMKPFVMWGDNRVAEIASRSAASRKFIDSPDETVREAVSLGRYVQDPLSETLNLWSHRPKENLVLQMALHPMQHSVPAKELHAQLEGVVLEVVGGCGVNVNRCFKLAHRASPLQFVSGLGPRKAEKFIQSLKRTMRDEYVANRAELEGCGLLSNNTYLFCIGFLRFYDEDVARSESLLARNLNLLDLTRIHPDNYPMANKMVLECLQVDFGRDDTKKHHNREVLRVMRDPEKLQELDLVDYGEHLSQKRKSNMHWQIQFIEKELAQPFLDPREDFRTNINMVELFYKLTNENKHVLYENALILMQVRAFDAKGLKLSTNHGVQAIISHEDLGYQLGDEDLSDQRLAEKFPSNSHVHVRVRKIDYIRLRLNVSVREGDLSAHKDFLRNSKTLEKWGLSDDSFKVYKDEDYPLLSGRDRQKFRLATRFVPRKIRHPHFKNMPLAHAQEYLKERPQGDFVIRPSSQGNSCLNVTWKIFPKVFCHLLIKEGHKAEGEEISQTLFLSREKEPFRSLDDIIESYLKPVNLLVRSVMTNAKFLFEEVEKVREKVKAVKKKHPNKIPYFFSTSQTHPQSLLLTYILHKLKVVHELVRLKPDGFIFHDQKFFSIEDLISFFKKNLKTAEYSKYVEKRPALVFGKKRAQREVLGRRGDGMKLDDRHGVKVEGNRDRDARHRGRYSRRRSDSSDSRDYPEPPFHRRPREFERPREKRESHRRSPVKREERFRPFVKYEDRGYSGQPRYREEATSHGQGYSRECRAG